MKTKLTRKLSLLLLSATFIFTSCEMSENMYINEDGSGKISIQVDGSGIMQMMGSSITQGEKMKMDSLFVFKDFLEEKKDSIATLSPEEQQNLKAIENFKMRIAMDSDSLTMNFDMFSDFTSVNELNDVFNSFQKGYKLASQSNKKLSGGGQGQALNQSGEPSSNVTYFYDKKKFKRTTEIANLEKFKKEMDSTLGPAKSMFGSSKYKLKYHFPRRIKKSSVEDAMFSADGKTIIIERGLIDYLSDPKVLDFEVEFED